MTTIKSLNLGTVRSSAENSQQLTTVILESLTFYEVVKQMKKISMVKYDTEFTVEESKAMFNPRKKPKKLVLISLMHRTVFNRIIQVRPIIKKKIIAGLCSSLQKSLGIY